MADAMAAPRLDAISLDERARALRASCAPHAPLEAGVLERSIAQGAPLGGTLGEALEPALVMLLRVLLRSDYAPARLTQEAVTLLLAAADTSRLRAASLLTRGAADQL